MNLLIIHQLPQILLAKHIIKRHSCRYLHKVDGVNVYEVKNIDGMSLGDTILVNPDAYEGTWLVKHEFGHVVQSRILGWLYLPFIFVPSFLWYKFLSWLEKKLNWDEGYSCKIYYKFYTEYWANKTVNIKFNKV